MFYLVQVITGKNRCEIGRRFGGRDHTTVLHAIRKITRKVVVDPEFAQMVAGLRAQIAARVG